MIFKPHHYQAAAIQHGIINPAAGLIIDMGLGKTASTLSIIDVLKYRMFSINRTLIVAPKRVAQSVWTDEVAKWYESFGHLTVSKILGTDKQRRQALQVRADIYIINRENLVWLITALGGAFPFDLLVIDELSSFKDQGSKRFKALSQVRPLVKRVIGLTGTFAPNGLQDIWSQVYLLDQGQRLGKTFTAYKEAYFSPKHGDAGRYGAIEIRKDINQPEGPNSAEREIYARIGDICISMKTEDYLKLPALIEEDVLIELPPDVKRKYDLFEEQCVLELIESLEPGETINAVNSGALNVKLAQFANGAIYTDDRRKWVTVHDEKTLELEEQIEFLQGKPCIVWYWFQHDLERLLKSLAAYDPQELTEQSIKLWNQRKVKVLLIHPQSGGHGLNLQDGGNHMFWYGNTWSGELKRQGLKRIHRQGVLEKVISKNLVCRGTIDEKMIRTVNGKIKNENQLTDAISYAKTLILKHQDKLNKQINF